MSKYFFTILVLLFSACSSLNTSPCFLQATYDSGSSSSSFAFRADGTFEWTNGSGLGVFQTEGRYELKDRIITLDKIGFDKVIKTNRLLLTSIHPNSHQVGKYVVQVDDQNKVIDSMFIFTVYVDNRNLFK